MSRLFCIESLSRPLPLQGQRQGQGEPLGEVARVWVDAVTGERRLAAVRIGQAGSERLVPWPALRPLGDGRALLATVTERQLRQAPSPSDRLLEDARLFRSLCRHYGLSLSGFARC